MFSVAELVRDAEQIASSGPHDWFRQQTKASGSNVSSLSLEDISELHQTEETIDEGSVSLHDQTNV